MNNSLASGVEVMAPAGSFEAMTSAIQAGADSIYFGVEQLNMRARSSNNFTLDDLERIAETCRKKGVKTYITLNTILYDHDIGLMKSITERAKNSGIDAIIASDPAVMSYAKRIQMPVHISTQANVSNLDTLWFYADYADTVVLARELSLKQVKSIVREIERQQVTGPTGELVRVEIFAHGALCMAVSGKCYLSLHSHYASANRGACIQNCRREYIVTEKEEGTELLIDNEYIMSAKDLCTIDFLYQVLDAGVKVLKIEGRGRSADYVHTTVQCYKEAVQSIGEGTYTREKVEKWKERLATVYNRGFWDGYYLGRTMGEWSDSYGSKASKKKIFIGRGMKYFPKAGVGQFRAESHTLSLGDQILITGPTTGLIETTVNELRVNELPVESVAKGAEFSLPIPGKVRPSDKLYKVVDA